MSRTVVGIIGTAGRQDDAKRLDRAVYDVMYGAALDAIAEWSCPSAVSGGAAWADHLAVRAFLEGKVSKLTLHLPAMLTPQGFANDPDARTANVYHAAFSKKTGLDSIAEIMEAVNRGATVKVSRGFKARNFLIGMDATHLIAFTFGNSVETVSDHRRDDVGFVSARAAGLKDGGTAHCFEQARNPEIKRHVNLFGLLAPGFTPSP